MWRNILCHAFMQIIMLLVLIFVLPGWLVHNYEVLQHPLAFTKDTAGNKVCAGFYQKKEDECSLLNPWYASEVYQDTITIGAWKNLTATKDSDYDQKALNDIRCFVWASNSSNSVALKTMGGLSKCNKAALIKADAQDYLGNPMATWYPQDYKFGDSTQKCIHFTYIF